MNTKTSSFQDDEAFKEEIKLLDTLPDRVVCSDTEEEEDNRNSIDLEISDEDSEDSEEYGPTMESIEYNEQRDDLIDDPSYKEQYTTDELMVERTKRIISLLQFLLDHPSEHRVFFSCKKNQKVANELLESLRELEIVAELHRKGLMEGNTNSPPDGVDVSPSDYARYRQYDPNELRNLPRWSGA